MFRGKKYRAAQTLVDADKLYSLDEAIELLERTNTVKFDPSVEIHFHLGIDAKYSDQLVRGTITLPHGSGKSVRIAAFTDSGNEKELMEAGAIVAGGDDFVDEVARGAINFDIAVATPAMMRKMGKIAKVLGPKGLMPNPKSGTVGDDLLSIIKELKAGKFEYKNDKLGNVHSTAGKLSFGSEKLKENIEHFVATLKATKPNGVKNALKFVLGISLCTTMGPGIRLSINLK